MVVFFKDFVRAITSAKNKTHMLVAYLGADFKTLDDQVRYYTTKYITVRQMHNRTCV